MQPGWVWDDEGLGVGNGEGLCFWRTALPEVVVWLWVSLSRGLLCCCRLPAVVVLGSICTTASRETGWAGSCSP